jgi:hypothetical protein
MRWKQKLYMADGVGAAPTVADMVARAEALVTQCHDIHVCHGCGYKFYLEMPLAEAYPIQLCHVCRTTRGYWYLRACAGDGTLAVALHVNVNGVEQWDACHACRRHRSSARLRLVSPEWTPMWCVECNTLADHGVSRCRQGTAACGGGKVVRVDGGVRIVEVCPCAGDGLHSPMFQMDEDVDADAMDVGA